MTSIYIRRNYPTLANAIKDAKPGDMIFVSSSTSDDFHKTDNEIVCKNCKHWKTLGENNEFRGRNFPHLGKCSSLKWKNGYHLSAQEVLEDEILVESDEGWAFYTGQNFGCIHWEDGQRVGKGNENGKN